MGLKRVFLVDDDRSVHFYNQWLLERMAPEAKVSEFFSAEEAIEATQGCLNDTTDLPDLIILDLNLPKMDGIDFAEAYYNLSPATRTTKILLLLSSRLLSETEKRARQAGIHHFAHKPLSDQALETVLQPAE